jgi:glycosyltransferase involved in cell wall biosynthesis
MMHLGPRPKILFPPEYKDFHLVRAFGRIYGIPPTLDPEEIEESGRLTSHPAILSAPTLAEMQALIDDRDAARDQPQVVGDCGTYHLVGYRGWIYGVPRAAGYVDLDLEDDRRRANAIRGKTTEEVRARIAALGETKPVEFAGWLPIFEFSGNCGRHPQFTHTAEPPPGYRFTCSAPPKRRGKSSWQRVGRWLSAQVNRALRKTGRLLRPLLGIFRGGSGFAPRNRFRTLGAIARLYFRLRRGGGRLFPVLRFLQSRHYRSQMLLAQGRGLVFLTSMPYTYGQDPWVIEIEDPTTLFYPIIQNGHTHDLRIRESPYFPIVKTLLEADSCKGIVTHMKSTARMVATLFDSETIRQKISYTPLGVRLPHRWQTHEEEDTINLVFINSWCQVPENFYVRGGLDILEAFAILHERYPQLRLTLRTSLPQLDHHYHRIIEQGWVRVINRFLEPGEMDALLADSHIFLLPAARVHIVSLLQAMSYGLAVVASDGWGIEEYIDHERNGLVVQGRYGKASWEDSETGILREDYDFMWTSDPEVVEGIVTAVSRLVEDRELRKSLGCTARQDVATKYTLERWNGALKEIFDRALVGGLSGGAVMLTEAGLTAREEIDQPAAPAIAGQNFTRTP